MWTSLKRHKNSFTWRYTSTMEIQSWSIPYYLNSNNLDVSQCKFLGFKPNCQFWLWHGTSPMKKWHIFIYWLIQLEGNLELKTQFHLLKFQLILWIKNFEKQILHVVFKLWATFYWQTLEGLISKHTKSCTPLGNKFPHDCWTNTSFSIFILRSAFELTFDSNQLHIFQV
jgi:hypothetical protein